MLTTLALVAVAQGYRAVYPLPDLTMPNGWGVNIHTTNPAPGEMDRLAGAGFRWIRMDLFWHEVERRRGEYDFSGYDRLMAALKAKGVRPLFILCYGNDLYQQGSPRTPEARAAFARFVEAAVRRYRGQGVIWETWNEPNIHFWSPRPNADEYIALAKEVQRTIRRVAPDEWHVGPAVSGFDWGFLRRCFAAGLLEGWDAVTVHPYRPAHPETVAADWARLAAMIERYKPAGKRVAMLSGEWGYSDVGPGLNRGLQADYAARMVLANMASGVPLTILYDWRDDGENPTDTEHHYGTVTHREMEPKPSYRSIQHLSRELSGYRYHLRLALPSRDDVLLAFRKGDAVKLVAYTTRRQPASVDLPVGNGSFRISTRDGAQTGRASRLRLTGTPQVLTPTSTSAALQAIARLTPRPATRLVRGVTAPVNATAGESVEIRRAGGTRERVGTANVRVGLDREPSTLRFSRRLPDGTVLAQETAVVVAQPITVSPTLGTNGVVVSIGNLEGNAFAGEVVVRHPSGVRRRTFDLRSSVASLPVVMEDVPAGWLQAGFDVEVRSKGELLASERGVALVRLPPLARVGQSLSPDYRIELDGSAEVRGRGEGVGVRLSNGPGGQREGLSLRYEMAPGWKYLMLKTAGAARRPLPGRPQALGMWIRGDGSGDMLRMRFQDATDQTFQPDYGPIDWTGWRYVTFKLDGAAAGRWGGANDGVVHYPITIDSLALIDNKGGGRPSEIVIAGPTLVGSSR